MNHEYYYVALIFGFFVLTRILERVWIPAGITCFFLGIITSTYFGLFEHDTVINLLAILGISSLFLFAGLEVDLPELIKHRKFLIIHIIYILILVLLVSSGLHFYFHFSRQNAILYSLALTTPSAGFILDSLSSLGLNKEQQNWIKTKAITAELVALFLMFFVTQFSFSWHFVLASGQMLLLVLVLPLLFWFFAKVVAPYAKNSEFSFIIMLAVLAGLITKKIGVYYLVGAFLVGIIARRFKKLFPDEKNEKLFFLMKIFSSFFIPFYFFKAGSEITFKSIPLFSVLFSLLLMLAITSLRVLVVVIHRKISFKEKIKESFPISIAITPNLIFGLVLANLMREKYALEYSYFVALIIYTLLSTLIPSIILKNTKGFDQKLDIN
ncbi:MAG: cation:proton antiporter [Bacteriovoracaceae bacterium]|nr:cation:proton antiporter [Bacteriovoracaceae bacterium]